MNAQWTDRIAAVVDPDQVCRLALDLCDIASPTGEEDALSAFIVDWFKRNGLVGTRQEVETNRSNAVGILRGGSSGPSLMLNGHMDTGMHLRHDEVIGPVPPKRAILPTRIEDGVLYGTGMDNMKSGLAAIMSAAKAIKDAGFALNGDLIVAGVAGEVSRAPVDQYQGPYYRSKGLGTRYLLTHGIISDYAIVADTSHFGLTWAQCGVVYAKITVGGRPFYTPFTRRSADPREATTQSSRWESSFKHLKNGRQITKGVRFIILREVKCIRRRALVQLPVGCHSRSRIRLLRAVFTLTYVPPQD